MKKVRIVSLIVISMLLVVTLAYSISGNKVSVYAEVTINGFSEPQVIEETYKVISREEFLQYLAKSKITSVANAIKIDKMLTKSFEEKHPEFFGKIANQQLSGHYEYGYISRTVDMGPIYGSRRILIKESVITKIYVNGSFRQFVYVSDPSTSPGNGYFTWHETDSHTFLDYPTQFTAMAAGYAEVAINSSEQVTLGVQLENVGFSFSYSLGMTYYYRKDCYLPQWTYNLYP